MRYIIFFKDINIKIKKIDIIKNWLKPNSVYNIKIFLGFTNFYWQFIKSFNKIVSLFILILKTIRLSHILVFKKNKSKNKIIKFDISDNYN